MQSYYKDYTEITHNLTQLFKKINKAVLSIKNLELAQSKEIGYFFISDGSFDIFNTEINLAFAHYETLP